MRGYYMKKFTEINVKSIKDNMFKSIGQDWMLITAGEKGNLNTMTASWGGIGVLWNKNVTFSFIRPQRYTFDFMEKNEYYSLSFFNQNYKKELTFCGTNSGRNINKIEKIAFNTRFDESAPYFDEARLTLICKKIYADFINPKCFIDQSLDSNYKDKDYHKMYIGEIVKVLINNE